jgi:DNA polymerase I-like protein with 3'-5' exonuclease and polymerase domains
MFDPDQVKEIIDLSKLITALSNATPAQLQHLRQTYPPGILNCARASLTPEARDRLNSMLRELPKVECKNRVFFAVLVGEVPERWQPYRNADVLAVDTETTGLDPHTDRVRLVQLAVAGHDPLVLDLWNLDPQDEVGLKATLNRTRTWVGHNLKFDLPFLWSVGYKPKGTFWDTMLGAQLLEAGRPLGKYSLAAVSQRYLNMTVDKTEQTSDWNAPELTEEQLAYAAKDAETTLDLYGVLAPLLRASKLEEVADIEFRALPAVAGAEYRGMRLDASQWRPLIAAAQTERDRINGEVQEYLATVAPSSQGSLFGSVTTTNLDSPQQLQEALSWVGIEVPNTSKDALSEAVGSHPIISQLLEYRQHQKFLSSFGDGLLSKIHPTTGRIHASYRQLGAASGRMSCTVPNLQQIPRSPQYRQCFVADPGHVFVIADYSQMELRLAAEVSGDPTMLEVFQLGKDPHRTTAAGVLGKPEDEVTKGDRQIAKSLNFGLIYGSGAGGLQRFARSSYGVDMSLEEAKGFRDRFMGTYPGISRWHTRISAVTNRNPKDFETRTLAGRRRWHPEPKLTTAANTPVQGTGADITKLALANLWPVLPDGAWVVGVVHDEIIVECLQEDGDRVAELLSTAMVEAGKCYLKICPVEADSSIGCNWAAK